MKSAPAFQFYPADWLADANVQMMTLEEEGAYIRLLCFCWREGSLPDDDEQLSRLTKGGSQMVLRVVRKCFNQSPTEPGRLVHARLEEERFKQAAWREKSAEGGRKSGETRRTKDLSSEGWLKGGSRVVEPNGNSSSSSSSSSSKEEHPPTPHAVPAVASATPEVVDPVTAKIHELAETLCSRHPAKTRCGPAEARKLLRTIVNHQPALDQAPPDRKSERQLWLLGMIDEHHAAWCSTDQWRRGFAKGLANWLAPTMMRYLTPPAAEQPGNGSLFAAAHEQPSKDKYGYDEEDYRRFAKHGMRMGRMLEESPNGATA